MTQEAINKVVRNGQVTIPAKIRMAMNLHDGDWIRLSFENNKLIITPVSIIDADYIKGIQSTLNEWESKEDDVLFKKL